jgi:mono/diheme cytochrome c family protein
MKSRKSAFLALTLLLGFSLSSCYYDNEEDLYPGSTSCDTSNVTYSNSVAPVFAANCNSCHSSGSPSGNIITDNYTSVKANISRIRGAVNHQSGYSQMPQNGSKLPTCELTKIDVWINQGMPNN